MLPSAAYSNMGEKIIHCGQYVTILHPEKPTVRKLDSEAPDPCKSLKLFFTNRTLASKYFFVPDLGVFQNKPKQYINTFTVTLPTMEMK